VRVDAARQDPVVADVVLAPPAHGPADLDDLATANADICARHAGRKNRAPSTEDKVEVVGAQGGEGGIVRFGRKGEAFCARWTRASTKSQRKRERRLTASQTARVMCRAKA